MVRLESAASQFRISDFEFRIFPYPFHAAINVSAITAGVSATAIPASRSAAIFPAAVPFLPIQSPQRVPSAAPAAPWLPR